MKNDSMPLCDRECTNRMGKERRQVGQVALVSIVAITLLTLLIAFSLWRNAES